jgi:hypothetical protein
MKIGTLARFAVAASGLVVLTSCGATNQLTSSWTDPTAGSRGFKKVVVVGATPNATARRTYEDQFVAELRTRGIDAVSSYTFGGSGQLDKDAAIAKLKEIGADGVVVTRLVDKQSYETYYPPTYSSVAAPASYYGGWYGYYSMGYTYMSSPGYVAENQVYKLETNLYDVTNDKLVYSGLTETEMMAGDQPETEIKPLIGILISDMEKKGIVPKKA